MNADQFRVRRRMAKTSFATLIFMVPALIALVFIAKPEQAPILNAVMPILVIIVPALVANVSHYMQLVSNSDQQKGESNASSGT